MNIDNKLSEIFELAPTVDLLPEVDIVKSNKPEAIDDDFEQVRSDIKELISTGKSALYDMIDVAKQTEQPRSYEVIGTLLKQLTDMNQQLLDVHQQKMKLTRVEPRETSTKTVTNNSIFVGTASELQKMIQKMNSGE